MQSEYYNGSSFVINTLDNCSSYLAASTALDFTPYPSDGLDDGETAVTAPTTATMLINGRNNSALTLLLSAPGTGNDGQVDLTLDIPA